MRLSELSFADLDDFSDEVWRTVARHPESDVAQLSGRLHRPAAVVEAEIGRLVDLGLLRPAGQRWEAQDPVVVLEAAHAAREAALAAERAAMASERARLYGSGLFGDYVAGRRRAGTHAGVQVHTRDEIFPRMVEMTARSSATVRFLLTGPPPAGLDAGDVFDALGPACARGVQVSSVWTPAALENAGRQRPDRRQAPIGRLRVARGVPTRVILWDDRAALLPLDEGDLDRGGLLVTAPTLVSAVRDMVGRVELSAEARHPVDATGDPALARRQRALVLLLDKGYDDARAARELRVSQRTVKRDVEKLYELWGVQSRFALGAAAARAGWLGRGPVAP